MVARLPLSALLLLLLPACARALTLAQAMEQVRIKARMAFLEPRPVGQAVTERDLLGLSSPELTSDLETGTRLSRLEDFKQAVWEAERLQRAAPGQFSLAEKTQMLTRVARQLELKPEQFTIAVQKYKKNGPGPLLDAAAIEAARLEQQARQARITGAVTRAGNGVRGWQAINPDAETLAVATTRPAPDGVVASGELARLNAQVGPGPRTVKVRPVPLADNPASHLEQAYLAARATRERSDAVVTSEFEQAYARDGGGWLDIKGKVEHWSQRREFWKTQASADVRPGETPDTWLGVASHWMRRADANVRRFGAWTMQESLDGVAGVERAVGFSAYAANSSKASDKLALGATLATIPAFAGPVTDALPGGKQVKAGLKVAEVAGERLALKAAARDVTALQAELREFVGFGEAIRPRDVEAFIKSKPDLTPEAAKALREKYFPQTADVTRALEQEERAAFGPARTPKERLAKVAVEQFGYHKDDVLLICEKRPDRCDKIIPLIEAAHGNPEALKKLQAPIDDLLRLGALPESLAALEGKAIKSNPAARRTAVTPPKEYGDVVPLPEKVYRGMKPEEFQAWLKNRGFPAQDLARREGAAPLEGVRFVSDQIGVSKGYAADHWSAATSGVMLEFRGAKGCKKTGGNDSQAEFLLIEFDSFIVHYIGPKDAARRH